MRRRIPDDRRSRLDAALAATLVVLLIVQVLTLDVAAAEKAGVCAWAAALLVTLALRRRTPMILPALVVAGASVYVTLRLVAGREYGPGDDESGARARLTPR